VGVRCGPEGAADGAETRDALSVDQLQQVAHAVVGQPRDSALARGGLAAERRQRGALHRSGGYMDARVRGLQRELGGIESESR